MKSKFDNWPEYFINPRTKKTQVISRDDFKDFLDRHKGHRIEELIVTGGPWGDKPYFEPLGVVYYRATNGRRDFTIKGSREKIEEPVVFQIISGQISEKISKIKIESAAIKKQIMAEKPGLDQGVLTYFIKLLDHLAWTSDHKRCEEDNECGSTPMERFFLLDKVSLLWLRRQLKSEELAKEKDFLNGFIGRESVNGGLLRLKVTSMLKVG